MDVIITDDMFPEDQFEEIKSIADDLLSGVIVDMDPTTEKLVNLRLMQLEQRRTGKTTFQQSDVDEVLSTVENVVSEAKKKKENKIIVSNFEITLTDEEKFEIKDAASGAWVRSDPYSEYNKPKTKVLTPEEKHLEELLTRIREIGESIYKEELYRESILLRKEYVECYLKFHYPLMPWPEAVKAFEEGEIKINMRPPTFYLSSWRIIKDPKILESIVNGETIVEREKFKNNTFTEHRTINMTLNHVYPGAISEMFRMKTKYNPIKKLAYFGIPNDLVRVVGVNDHHNFRRNNDKRITLDLMNCSKDEFASITSKGRPLESYNTFDQYLSNIEIANKNRVAPQFKNDLMRGYNELFHVKKTETVDYRSMYVDSDEHMYDPFNPVKAENVFKDKEQERNKFEEDLIAGIK